MIIAGDKFNFYAAKEFTKRSEPASFGLSILTFIPISKLFSPTINVLTLKYFFIKDFMFRSVSGTTDAMHTPVISLNSNFDRFNICNNQG